MTEIRIPIHEGSIDKQYGRIDLAPRVMDITDPDGRMGWVVGVRNRTSNLIACWEDLNGRDATIEDVSPDTVRWILAGRP